MENTNEKYPSAFGQAPPPAQPFYPQQQGQMPPPPSYDGHQQQYGQPPSQYPQQPGFVGGPAVTSQPMGQPTQTVIHVSGRAQQRYGDQPVSMICPNCGQNITTSTYKVTSVVQWAAAGGLLVVGCWLGCCLIPLCIDSLQDVKHSCPNCKAYLGMYKRY